MNDPASRRAPTVVAWLGYGGLVPFVSLGLAFVLDRADRGLVGEALVAYGAVILSFVGALHWAFAMTLPDIDARDRTRAFVWSVVPALVGWVAALLVPVVASVALIAGFLAHYGQDLRLASIAKLPRWYLPLRLRLTAVASLALAVAGVAAFYDGAH
jgi:hypothetical protein